MLNINTLQRTLMERKEQTYTFPQMLGYTGSHLTSNEGFRKFSK